MVKEKSLENLKQFTKTNRPKNPGRKPSKLRKYIKETNVSREDVSAMIKNVVFAKSEQDLKKILTDPTQPMVIRLFIKAFLNDFKKGGLVNLEVLMNRAFGSPKQEIDLNGEMTVTAMSHEEREARIDELMQKYIKEHQDQLQGGGQSSDRSDTGVPGKPEEDQQEKP
jgi:hypothetical protein